MNFVWKWMFQTNCWRSMLEPVHLLKKRVGTGASNRLVFITLIASLWIASTFFHHSAQLALFIACQLSLPLLNCSYVLLYLLLQPAVCILIIGISPVNRRFSAPLFSCWLSHVQSWLAYTFMQFSTSHVCYLPLQAMVCTLMIEYSSFLKYSVGRSEQPLDEVANSAFLAAAGCCRNVASK